MRTTVDINEPLLRRARVVAIETGRTLGDGRRGRVAPRVGTGRARGGRPTAARGARECVGRRGRPLAARLERATRRRGHGAPSMTLVDVNLLVYAFQPASEAARSWLDALRERPFWVADEALLGFMRIVTNSRIFATPSTVAEALEFVAGVVAPVGGSCRVPPLAGRPYNGSATRPARARRASRMPGSRSSRSSRTRSSPRPTATSPRFRVSAG
jgi:hypothetical protein